MTSRIACLHGDPCLSPAAAFAEALLFLQLWVMGLRAADDVKESACDVCTYAEPSLYSTAAAAFTAAVGDGAACCR
jgi:hypothetical protein